MGGDERPERPHRVNLTPPAMGTLSAVRPLAGGFAGGAVWQLVMAGLLVLPDPTLSEIARNAGGEASGTNGAARGVEAEEPRSGSTVPASDPRPEPKCDPLYMRTIIILYVG